MSAPIAKPPTMSLQPTAPIIEMATPVLSAVPTAAATELTIGVIDWRDVFARSVEDERQADRPDRMRRLLESLPTPR